MSSPPGPGRAGSPPGSSFALPNPRKRPSISTAVANTKRRKASFASVGTPVSAHPLRQTSFPPEAAVAADSPSRQSSFSPSVVSHGRSSTTGAKRGRKKGSGKKAQAEAAAAAAAAAQGQDDEQSTTGAPGKSARDADDEDDDDEDDGAQDAVLERAQVDEGARRLEREHMLMLLNAFDPEQFERYEVWRRVRLKKETVRKIVNQTLSQSVPASVVTTVMTSTKIFIGELVEAAREVQAEWLAAAKKWPGGDENPRFVEWEEIKREEGEDAVMEVDREREGGEWRDVREIERGPLLPVHLREALRRYKKDREGGSVGFQGMSLHGVDASASRVRGKRLFK